MKSRVGWICLVPLTALFTLAVGWWWLGEVPGPRAPAPRTTDADLAALLDPTVIGRHLCGRHGQTRGLFFRPAFQLAMTGQAQAAEPATEAPPLWPGLGAETYPITTDNPRAQAYFDQGIKLMFGFNHWEAVRAFREAQQSDPTCAICYWGEAFALGPNINAPMVRSAREPAFAASAKAQALAERASSREQGLIAALAKRYTPDPKAKRAALDQAFAGAMAELYRQYPDDHEIAAFYAESLMDLTPWNYWERDFKTPNAQIRPAIAAIEKILAAKPDHVGAIHLYIHLMEASQMPERAEPYADRLAGQIPGAGHLVHMPAHIYFRIGRYIDSLDVNIDAVAADEAYLDQVEGSAIYRYGYYPHNVHFVLVSAQMAADEATALEFAAKLDALIPYAALETAAWLQPIKAAPYFAAVQFGSPEVALAAPAPPEQFPYLTALWRYVRGTLFARAGRLDEARAEAAAIAGLRGHEGLAPLAAGGVPAGAVVEIAGLVVEARIAQHEGHFERAAELLEQAAGVQDALTYSEPPYWYYSVRQTLGAVYLQAGRADDAAQAFTDSLIKHPNNAWSLYGLWQAQLRQGDGAAAVTRELYRNASRAGEAVPLELL